MSRFPLTEMSLPVPEGLSCRFLLAERDQTAGMTILVVAFDGDYPDGSFGNAHGAFIASSALHGLHVFDADCVILDFRGMSYRWGNRLLQVFQDIAQFKDADGDAGAPAFPVLAVTSAQSQAGFLSLVTRSGQAAPSWHFDDLDAAIAHGTRTAREWLDFI